MSGVHLGSAQIKPGQPVTYTRTRTNTSKHRSYVSFDAKVLEVYRATVRIEIVTPQGKRVEKTVAAKSLREK